MIIMGFKRNKKMHRIGISVITKIFEDFGGTLCKAFIIGQEPVSIVHYYLGLLVKVGFFL